MKKKRCSHSGCDDYMEEVFSRCSLCGASLYMGKTGFTSRKGAVKPVTQKTIGQKLKGKP